jgi:hypothetical protein
MTRPRKCSVRWYLRTQPQRSVPLAPLGHTIQQGLNGHVPLSDAVPVTVLLDTPTLRNLLAHATEEYCPDYSLYKLLQQTNVDILVASDGGHKDDYGSFGRVIGTNHELIWDCEGIALPGRRIRTHVRSPVLDSLHSLLQYQTGGWPTCHVLLRHHNH